ncbi:MAG: hypothetical protein K8F25_00035 [Fimbriimonadaceae bacterium]|nr:hypothetical protein [Alphaproteobacteria bacterium]
MKGQTNASFPAQRMRRNRQHEWSRRLMCENRLSVDDFILPIFLIDGKNKREQVVSMPGVERLSVDQAVLFAKEARDLGIPCIAPFPYTDPALKR